MKPLGRLIVTGASGFIGRELVARLASDGWEVGAAARDPDRVMSGANIVRLAHGDLAAPHDWRPLLRNATHVVHLAGIAHATSSIPEAAYRAVNAEAVRTLAEAAREQGGKRVVLMSSIRAQCGAYARTMLDETVAPAPDDAYGRSKLEGERLMAAALEGSATEWCVLRPVVVYGPGVKGNMETLVRLARSPLPLPLGGLAARRSILGLANLHAAVTHALTSPAARAKTFVVADPGPLTVPEMLAAMRAGLERAPRILSVPLSPLQLALRMAGRGAAWQRIAGDLVVSTAALEASGWQPVETATEGLQRWMRESGPRPTAA